MEAIPRDKIVADLTTPGTPYWRLKTVMDAWCALWFWPLDKAALLDGSDDGVPEPSRRRRLQQPEPPPVDPDPAFPEVWEMDSLFGETPKQLTLAEATPRKPRPKPVPVDHRPVPLANLDDWLDFAEALLGRQDIAADSLASHFTSLSEMEEYEDKLESDFYMNMDPVHRLGERFPWLDTVEDDRERTRASSTGNSASPRSSPTAASTSRSGTRRGCGRNGKRTRSLRNSSRGSSLLRRHRHLSAEHA